MTLQQLKYFIKVCECKTISQAANELYISQPSLSAAIKEIEKEYSQTLFIRNSNGVQLSLEGSEFLSFARTVIEQSDLLEEHYLAKKKSKKICSISSQHYSFVVSAFAKSVKEINDEEYEFILRETKTYEIIEDIESFRSELGILFLSDFNDKIITNILQEKNITYEPLFSTSAYVFISNQHPLAKRKKISLNDLEDYPCLSFEQGIHNSKYYSEELLHSQSHKKNIRVSDRATLFNLLVGLNGYTICSGIIDKYLNGSNIIAVPLDTKEKMKIYYLYNKKAQLSAFATRYLKNLKEIVKEKGM